MDETKLPHKAVALSFYKLHSVVRPSLFKYQCTAVLRKHDLCVIELLMKKACECH